MLGPPGAEDGADDGVVGAAVVRAGVVGRGVVVVGAGGADADGAAMVGDAVPVVAGAWEVAEGVGVDRPGALGTGVRVVVLALPGRVARMTTAATRVASTAIRATRLARERATVDGEDTAGC